MMIYSNVWPGSVVAVGADRCAPPIAGVHAHGGRVGALADEAGRFVQQRTLDPWHYGPDGAPLHVRQHPGGLDEASQQSL